MTWRPFPMVTLTFGLLGGVSHPAYPQHSGTRLGFELGYSRAHFAASALDDTHEGSLIGGFLAHRVSGPLSAQIELLFTTKGGGLSANTSSGPAPAAVQLVYIELPLLARLTLPIGRQIRPALLGGGSYALSVGCEFEVDVPTTFGQNRCDQPGTGIQLVKSDMSAIVGGGVEYLWGNSTVRLELRRFLGLRNVVEGGSGKNRSWVALVGFTF